ncbi:MAG: radical SAM protein [Methanomassiliicoccales archaeon]|nr:radical SAM protein [Methanomassiliicoccales archaeon]
MRRAVLFRPGADFPSISVTGRSCALMCRHCQGRYLQGMTPVQGPEELLSSAEGLVARGAEGFLLSGGCDDQGKVPLSPYLDTVRRIKSTMPLDVNLHPGLVSEDEAAEIARSDADRISFDLVLDDDVIRNDMHMDRSPTDYLRSFHALCRAASGRVTPHILLGLGDEKMELEAVKVAASEDVPCVILLSLLGEKVDDWQERLVRAVEIGASSPVPIILGCMRPRGHPGTEMAAMEAGAAGIACPSPATVGAIKGKGWEIVWRKECCAFYR